MMLAKKTISIIPIFLIAVNLWSDPARAERKLKGYYQVPGLVHGNEFLVRGERLRGSDETYSFQMPRELFGQDLAIAITFMDQSVTEITNVESRDCLVRERNVNCQVTFDRTLIDVEAARRWIINQDLGEPLTSQRLATLQAFSGEPIGILKYRRKGRH